MKKNPIVIIGTGVAGLFCALSFPKDIEIILCTKEALDRSDSSLAQGGICVLRGEEDYQAFFEDTLKAGHQENNPEAVDRMIRRSNEIIKDLVRYRVNFEKEGDEFLYTKEGAHSKARILYHTDSTGKEITDKLIGEAKRRKNISFLENTTMIDLFVDDNACRGVIVKGEGQSPRRILADYVVLATGGIGGLYAQSTNHPHLTGDGIALALKYGVEVKHLNYIQIHPTTLYSKKQGRRFLISESVRGEGGVLLNKEGMRFIDELLPRDLLTQAIYKEMRKDNQEYVWLSMCHLGEEYIKKRFPNIYEHCLCEGYDVTKESIPVVPAQHYLMGGIQVSLQGRTSMNRLYAIGETSHTGVHGANRLASNSLLESLVFAKEAAEDIAREIETSNHGDSKSKAFEKGESVESYESCPKEYNEDDKESYESYPKEYNEDDKTIYEAYPKEYNEDYKESCEANKKRILDEIERENQNEPHYHDVARNR